MPTITPTVGRVVHFHRNGGVRPVGCFVHDEDPQPCLGQIVYVYDDRCVNLVVHDHQGQRHGITSVKLVQPGDERPAHGTPYCEWMPYQKGLAATTEALKRELRHQEQNPAATDALPST